MHVKPRAAMIVVALLCSVAHADLVRGVVTHNGRPIAGASVLTERGAIVVTDLDGFFRIDVAKTDRELTVVAQGFITRTVRVEDTMSIELEAASGAEVIEVIGKAPEETKPLRYTLTVDEIRSIPGAGNDILRSAQVLPGVARIPFSFGGLVLRGTSPRDTSVYVDGIEVPLAFHFGGVTSFYPSGMLDDLTLANGGFDASYGRAQGGLVTLTTRAPRRDRWRLGGSIGLFDSSIQAEGPWNQGGVIIGFRRSYFDRIADPFVDDDIALPSYYDFQIKTSWGDSRKGRGRIDPMLFASIDRVASNEVAATSMFVRAAMPWLRQWGPTSVRVVPWIGTNQLRFENDEEEDHLEFKRPVYLGGVRGEVLRDYRWGHLRGGAEVSSGYLDQLRIDDDDDADLGGTSTVAWNDFALWSEGRFKLDGERIAFKPGVRVEYYGLSREAVVDPRLNIHQKLTPWLTLRQAIGRYHQPPLPSDVDEDFGNTSLHSSYNDQMSLGVDTELPGKWLVSTTGFYNYGKGNGVRVRDPSPGSELPEPNLGGLGPTFQLILEKQLGFAFYRENLGRARSYGLELSIKRSVAPWFALVSYTLARAERTDDPRVPLDPLVPWRPFELDQRHNLQIVVSRQFSKWKLGGRMQLVSGNPYSPSRLGPNGDELQDPWAGRLPVFFSLDLRADRRWHKCWGDLVFYIDVQNVTNRRNVEGREFDFDSGGDEDIRGLPIIPFLGLEFLPLI